MKRSASMKRGAPMLRKPFKPKAPVRPPRAERTPPAPSTVKPLRVGVLARIDGAVRASPKEDALQHEAYMAAVRKLPCAHCGVAGFTQFCHSDEGKGQGYKTDCRRGWPGCGPHHDTAGCHYLLGSTGKLGREKRRQLESDYGRRTRAEIRALGQWPASLPPWPGDEPGNDSTFDQRRAR